MRGEASGPHRADHARLADGSLLHGLPGGCELGEEPHHVGHKQRYLPLCTDSQNLLALGHGAGQGLFAHDGLSGPCGRQDRLRVGRDVGADIHDVGRGQQVLQGIEGPAAPAFRRRRGGFRHDIVPSRQFHRQPRPGRRVNPGDATGSDNAYPAHGDMPDSRRGFDVGPDADDQDRAARAKAELAVVLSRKIPWQGMMKFIDRLVQARWPATRRGHHS